MICRLFACLIPHETKGGEFAMPRKPANKKADLSTKNKSNIDSHQSEFGLKVIKPIEPVVEDWYKCCTCGKKYKRQSGNFSYSQSPLYKGNNSFLPICNNCLENLVEQYTEMLGNQNEAIKRVCMHWDIYFSESLLNSAKKVDAGRSRIKCYIKNCNLQQNAEKTYDTYLKETNDNIIQSVDELEKIKTEGQSTITKAMFERWGQVSIDDIVSLENHYKMLKKQNPNCDNNQEIFIKDLCYTKLLQLKAFRQSNSSDFEKYTKLYRDTFKQAGLKTIQEDDGSSENTLGINAAIISQFTPEEFYQNKQLYKDFDGLGEYFERHVLRPLINLEHNDNKRDPEFNVGVNDED